MSTIREVLEKTEMKADMLTIAMNLEGDDTYTKQDAIQDLLNIIKKFDL